MFSLSDEKPQRVALYCRVSSDEQADAGTIRNQTDFLHKFCDLYSLPLAGVYLDDGISGTIPIHERPEGKRLIEDARSGRFTAVLVYRVDRLARSLAVLLEAHRDLDAAGITIRSATEPFDSSTPIGRFLFQLLGSLAELDRASLLDRLTLGRDRVAGDGKWIGGWVPYGYETHDDGCLTPSTRTVNGLDVTEADIARELFVRLADGSSLYAEAARLNGLNVPAVRRSTTGREMVYPKGWTQSRVETIVHNPVYKAEAVLKSKRGPIPMPAPALVDAELWAAAARQLTRNRKLSRAETSARYLLRGLTICETCGSAFVGQMHRQTRKYRCGRNAHPGSERMTCQALTIVADPIEAAIWNDCREFIRNPGPTLDDARAQLRERMATSAAQERERPKILRQIAEKDQERERVMTLYRRNHISLEDVDRQMAAITVETNQLREMLAAMNAQDEIARAFETQVTDTSNLLAQLRERLDEIEQTNDWEWKRKVVELLVARVSIATEGEGRARRSAVTVRYTFGKPSSGSVLTMMTIA